MPSLRQILWEEISADPAHAEPYWGETFQLFLVQQQLQYKQQSHCSHENPHWGEALYVQAVSQELHPKLAFDEARANSHGGEAVQM
mmetsp:Transcript_33248/g.61796  ORF Transcript_33248/g.61796 Transcript_33248/m.61796 type:complete len:86 (+) Transcript_33248:216-473(+)